LMIPVINVTRERTKKDVLGQSTMYGVIACISLALVMHRSQRRHLRGIGEEKEKRMNSLR
jgi:hypothetical protein